MSFTAKNMEDFFTSSAKGKSMNMRVFKNQKGGGLGNQTGKRRILYSVNQIGSGNLRETLVTPVAQDIEQAKSRIQNHLKRSRSPRTTSQSKRQRRRSTSKRKQPKKTVKKKSKKINKKKPLKSKKKPLKKVKKNSKKKSKKKTGRKRTQKKTKIDIFGR